MAAGTNAIERAYSRARLLSLDVAVAALAGGILAMRITGGEPYPAFYWLLPAGVWVVYTVDHLFDAVRMGSVARTPRHRFHRDHATGIWIATVAIAVVCAVGGWIGLSGFGLIYAAGMCGLVAIHEVIVKLAGDRASPLLVKELGVAVVFTAGVWGMPLLRHRLDTGRWLGWPVLLVVQYLLLAIANLVEFSIYESKIDTVHCQTSFVRGIGRGRAAWVVVGTLATQISIGIAAVAFDRSARVIAAESIYALMTAGLWFVLRHPRIVARAERYRTLGDGVFLLPLLMLLLVSRR